MPSEPRPELIDDDRLIEALGSALIGEDAVPVDLVAFASASLSWRTVGRELAELLYDSARDETVAVRDAGPSAARMLSFGGGEGGTEGENDRGVELELDGDRVLGVIRPEGRYRIEVHRAEVQGPQRVVGAETDATGMFELRIPPRGAARLVVTAREGRAVEEALVTVWFDLG